MNNRFNVTRIAFILKISRVTLYDYILKYDDENKRQYVPDNVIKVLDYLNSCPIINEYTYAHVCLLVGEYR